MLHSVENSEIFTEYEGSDHCPIRLVINTDKISRIENKEVGSKKEKDENFDEKN